MEEKEIIEQVWREHLDNKNNKHELKEHFCRACLDLSLKLYKEKVREVIERNINPMMHRKLEKMLKELGLENEPLQNTKAK